MLILGLAACSASPGSVRGSRKSVARADSGVTMFDSAFNLRYCSAGKYYIGNLIAMGDDWVVFDKCPFALISIHVNRIVQGRDTIGRAYQFDDETHRLSHFYTHRNGLLHGIAVFYTATGTVERSEYYEEGEHVKGVAAGPASTDRSLQRSISDDSIGSMELDNTDNNIFKKNSGCYYRTQGKGVLFIGTLCFVISQRGALEAVYTQCSKRNNKLYRCGEAYCFNPQSHYLVAVRNYRNNSLYGKSLYFNENGMVIRTEDYAFGKRKAGIMVNNK